MLKNSKGKGRVPWKTVSASLLKKTWLLFGKYNKINDNAIDKIADQILTNIARLNASTAMMGHSTYDVRPEIEDNCGITFNDKEWDDWMSTYFTNNEGSWMLSDYGLPKLEHLYYEIFNAKTSEEKLYAIDKALNVIHQRNDLAAMFVEGGSKTLLDIANQGGYVSPDDIKEGIGWHGAYQAILLSNPSSLVFAENDEDTHIEIVNRIFKKEMKEFMSQFEKSGYGDEDDPECKYLAANSLAEKYNLARCIIENDQILYVNTPKNKELSNSQLRVLKDYCIEHKLRLKHSNCMGKGTCEIDLSEGYGTGNPDEDPKAVGRWTVKFDSDSKILKENHKLPLSAFTSGYCAEFALALHERTGYPIVSFDENIKHDEDDIETQSIHYACKHKNLYYDAKGKRNEEEIRKSLIGSDMNPAVNVSIRKLTADYLENETEIVDDALEQARQIVGKMKNIGEGFDPTSCGPNPQATEGQPQDPNFYQDNINKMRQLEEDSINENFDVSVKNLIKSVVDSNISKILKESMDVYIKGYNYSRKLNKLEDLTNHLLDKALLPGLKSLPADQLTYFQKNKIGTVYDMLTPDGDYWQGPSGGVGTINFYTAGLTTKTIRKVLLDILRECKKLNIKVDKLKIEDSKMFKKSQVIRISIIKNKNEYSGPPELNMSNINGYHMFKQILQFEPDDNYGSSFSMKTQDLIDRINAINGDKDWVSQNIRKPTDSKNDQSDTPESGEDWKQETEPEDSDNPHDAIIKQLGQGGARMIGGGLNSDAIHERLSKIMEIALWAKKHGFEEMYIS